MKELNGAMKNDGPASKKKESGRKRPLNESNGENGNDGDQSGKTDSLPDAFESVARYKVPWSPLLISEAKAQLISEVIGAQSSASTAWLRGTGIAMGELQ